MQVKKKAQRLPSRLVKCDICGKEVFERGLKSHVRLQHHFHFREVTKVIPSVTKVSDVGITSVKVSEVVREYSPWEEYMMEMRQDRIERGRRDIAEMKADKRFGSSEYKRFEERLKKAFRPDEWIEVTKV